MERRAGSRGRGPLAIRAYLGAYGPATMDAFGNWLAGGYFGKRQLRAWFGELEPQLAEVDVDGVRAFVLARPSRRAGLDASATAAVRLLPGFDQYVLGPGTGDGRVVPGATPSSGQPAGGMDLAGRGRRRPSSPAHGSWTET